MNESEGVVVAVSAGSAEITVRRDACRRCQSGRGCGAGLLTGRSRDICLTVPVAEELRLTPGDRVALTLSPGLLTRGVLTVYGLPLTGLVAGAAVAAVAGGSDLASIALVSAGLLLGLLAGRALARRDRCLSTLRPTATGRLAGADRSDFV